MIRINYKPLSVNECFKGRRFKTDKYKVYEQNLLFLLPKLKIPEGKLKITYRFGLSKLADIDNPVKNFTDILQKKYGFNDRYVYEMHIYKEDAIKGNEFIEFKIEQI